MAGVDRCVDVRCERHDLTDAVSATACFGTPALCAAALFDVRAHMRCRYRGFSEGAVGSGGRS
eukprot:2074623-Pyramimonas_sp.AAC.2